MRPLPWAALLLLANASPSPLLAGSLSDPQVDSYNVRVGTETFAGLYKFTTNTLLVETAQAITNFGSDTIKLYMGNNTSGQSGVTLGSHITNLLTLARDEPSYRQVLNMPFRHFVMWEYPFSNPDAPFQDGDYTPTEQANDYREMYALASYLLTNYNNSGKSFYLGHWEGDGYLEVNGWTTNPSPAVVTNMILWENTRQKAVDDARSANVTSNVNIYYYAEANRVRDAMNNGPNNNVRMIDSVIPFVTNLDYISYSSYDAMNLSSSDLYTTLDYMEDHFPTNKAATVPGPRLWIGEYGWGTQTTAQQEPLNRAYIQRLLGWNWNGQCLPFILFWEMYSNYNPNGGTNFCLINYADTKVESWYLFQRFINQARLLTAQFKESHGRLPSDTEFSAFCLPMLNQPVSAPLSVTVNNNSAFAVATNAVNVSGTLAQEIYGDDRAALWVFWGLQDAGTVGTSWQHSQLVAVNTNFNPATFGVVLTNLSPNTTYYWRFYATNADGEVWAPATSQFISMTVNPSDFSSRLLLTFTGYDRPEVLSNFPVLVNLSTNLPGFSYRQFASPSGGDLRFADSSGLWSLPYEVDEWNTNGVSSVWVSVPRVSGPTDSIWAYWGNPLAANPPPISTNGAAWTPNYYTVYHLKETGFPYQDSTQIHPALSGVAPASAPGRIGHGAAFSGSQFLDAGVVGLVNSFTLSAWVNIATTASDIQTIWANQKGGYGSPGFAWFVNTYKTSNQEMDFASGDSVNGNESTTASGTVGFGQWHLLSTTVNRPAGTAQFYLDGALVQSTSAIVTGFANQAGVNLGRFTNASFYFNGTMDEARIASVPHSSNWVWADWMAVASNSVFASYSAVARTPPLLSIAAGSQGVSLTWPAPGVGFAVYSATNLTPPVFWSPATNVPALTNSQWQVTLPPGTNPARFYRLQPQ